MKWIFLAGLMILTPMLAVWLRGNRRHLPIAAMFLGLLPFLEAKFNITASPYSWPAWQGIAKGIDLSLMDAVAIAMIVAGGKSRTPVRIKLAMGFYLLAFVVSTAVAEIKTPSIFYLWTLVRCTLVYYAIARASAVNKDVPLGLLTGLIGGLSVQAVVVLSQKATGAVQATGWFIHQNLLGMTSHFVVYPAFAAFLGGYYNRRTLLCLGAAFIVAWGGGSRATLGLLAFGLVLTMILSCRYRMNSRKMTIVALGLVCLTAAIPIGLAAIDRRSADIRAGSSEERERMKASAAMIIADYPLGIGANRYVAVANVGGYNARAGIAWSSFAALAHNTFYLVTAEMGWLGLFALIGMLVSVFSLALSDMARAPPGFSTEYSIGIAVTILMVAAHSYFEWISMLFSIHILFAMTVGTLVALRGMQPKQGRVAAATSEAARDLQGAVQTPA
ncbi:MAG: hypothetical protein HOP96_09970 [Sphingomonas sp.]|nr:hypothetical protein [Sphingomonas sp.]